jgi:HlyD family secretion protein
VPHEGSASRPLFRHVLLDQPHPAMRPTFILISLVASAALSLVGCRSDPPEALGTLEWDRVNGRAVASEVIVEVLAEEGERVVEGQPLLRIDARLQVAQVARLKAHVSGAEWKLTELESGYRVEEVASAEAELDAALYNLKIMKTEFDRKSSAGSKGAISQQEKDVSANSLAQAKATERSAEERLKMLKSGYRSEEIEQAKAKLDAARAELVHAEESLSRYTVTARRGGLLDSVPFKLGDKPPAGAVVTTVLAEKAPWARIYLPEPWLSRVKPGDTVDILVDGLEGPITGTVRNIQSNASFTPYYTLSEVDRSRLSFVTEVDLDVGAAADLPLGIPVRMRLRDE